MTKQFKWLRLWLRLAGLASATVVFSPLAGCRQEVVVAFYTGLEELIISLIQTYFEAVIPTTASAAAQSLSWLA